MAPDRPRQRTELDLRFKRLVIFTACAFLAMLISWALVGDRPASYSAHMRTRGLDITHVQQPSSPWLVNRAQLCVRNDVRLSGIDAVPQLDGPACDPRLYSVEEVVRAELLWPAGTRLQIARVAHDAPLEIDVLETGERLLALGDHQISRYSRLIIANEDWQKEGTLTLEGEVTLGDTPGSGSAHNVIEGSFAVSEAMFGYDKPVEVYSAPLRSGDVLQVLDEGRTGFLMPAEPAKPVAVAGFIEPAGKDVSGFMATIYSPYGDAVLRIDRYGAMGLKIVPDKLDRAVRSPAILALAGLLAVISVVAGLWRIFTWGRDDFVFWLQLLFRRWWG